MGSPSGRLVRSEPNMQHIVPKTELGQKLREAFLTQLEKRK